MSRAAALTLTLAAFTSLVLVPSAAAQDQVPQEIQTLVEVVQATVRGQVAPAARPFEWENDFLKGVDGNTYVPFTLVIDTAKVTSPTIAMYVFVTEHAPTDQPADQPAAPDSGDRQSPALEMQDAYFIDVDPSESVAHRISRSFSIPGGEYDVYVAIKATGSSEDTAQAALRSAAQLAFDGVPAQATVMVLKQELTVPDLWSNELATSTVIMTQRVEALDAPLSPEEQLAKPYVIGTTRLVPVTDLIFAASDELSLVLLVYNPSLNADNKPDVTVEYDFHRQTSTGEEYFNRTTPNVFNAETLPATCDVSAGHQIVAGQAVPLSLFPEGDYRLEITVEDKASGASVIRDVMFTVGAP